MITIAILLKYLLKKGYKGSVVKTVGSSILIDVVAKKLGVDVIETAVGFKHVGEAMRKYDVIIGGEESGGLSIKGHIPEKDGIIANLLVLESMATNKKTPFWITSLCVATFILAGFNHCIADAYYILISGNTLGISWLGTLIDTKDGVKLMLGNKTKILVRPSGTEPLLRIYFESYSEEELNYLKEEFIV